MTVDELNGLSAGAAQRELERCCGSSRWAAAMSGRRPFRSLTDAQRAADEVWSSMESGDWLEAFSHHPRIGERAAGWAKDEQAGAAGTSGATVNALKKLNREYERKFGHVFLIFATGRSAAEMLRELQNRITNDPAVELRIAAAEQAKITRLRLEKLLASSPEPSRSR